MSRISMIWMAHQVMLSFGWKRRAIAFAAGAAGALALSPVDFWPAMFVPMTVAIWLIDGSMRASAADGRGRALLACLWDAAGAGWWLGFGYFIGGFWWLGAAMFVEPDKFLWALPLAVFGLPAGLAIFTAAGFVVSRLVWSGTAGRIFALVFGLGCAEWFRGNLFTGFPWNLIGMSLAGNLVMAQTASIVGVYGMTFLAIALFSTPATMVDGAFRLDGQTAGRRFRKAPILLAVLSFCGLFVFGQIRLDSGVIEFVPNVKLRLVQPNIPQDDKFRPENKERILSDYLNLSDRSTSPQVNGIADVTHLFWPESAFPFILSRDPAALSRIGDFLGSTTILLTGAARVENIGALKPKYFNSIYVIGKGGVILDTYDKTHLVPFGEYLPMAQWLEQLGLRQIVQSPGGFEAGSARKLLAAPGLPPIVALICYEVLFSGEVTPSFPKAQRPKAIVNVTNDAWFGNTSGPYQHFAQARLRSIEEGLPLIRAANSGISAIIDPFGRIVKSLPLAVEGVLDGELPKNISQTIFSKYQDVIQYSIMLLALMLAMWSKLAGNR